MGFSPLMRVDGLCQCAHSDSWIMWRFFLFLPAAPSWIFGGYFHGQKEMNLIIRRHLVWFHLLFM
jgi:hypothetical protein